MDEARKDAVETKWWERQMLSRRRRPEAEQKWESTKKLDFSGGIPDEARPMALKYMDYGYTYGELDNILRESGTPMSVSDANRVLQDYMKERYGPRPSGEDTIAPYIQRMTPSGKIAREISSVTPHAAGERKPDPAYWPEGYVTRAGMEGFFKATDVLENWVGTPGSKPGTIGVDVDPDDPAKMLKIAKMIQQGNLVYKQHELYTSGSLVTSIAILGKSCIMAGTASTILF